MNFSSIMKQLANVVNTLSFELALKKDDNEKHLRNALLALNLCIDHLIAFKANNNQGAPRGNHQKEREEILQ